MNHKNTPSQRQMARGVPIYEHVTPHRVMHRVIHIRKRVIGLGIMCLMRAGRASLKTHLNYKNLNPRMGQGLRSHANLINMKVTRKVAIVLAIPLLMALGSSPAHGVDKPQIISYAGSILTPLELSAALTLWEHESHWNVHARNAGHYGLCQGRSLWLSKQGYKKQVVWCIHYAWHRYGTMNGALKHWQLKGWH